MKKVLIAAALATYALSAQAADTLVAQAQFQVTMRIEPTCSVSADAPLNFGSFTTEARNLQSSTTISVKCSKDTQYQVGLLPSNNNNQGAGDMKQTGDSANKVAYQLRQTVEPEGAVWGDTPDRRVTGTGDSTSKQHTVYATAPTADAKPGDYTDTVTVNVYF
ncbi:spore coat U domain-containing protein [Niveibacterium sp. SC-1]|uniref:Csu type fimbrial protein n=1 Tax=Niveibacterium sp. SC-1 TaxID=3135646 RepID=UPI00311FE326